MSITRKSKHRRRPKWPALAACLLVTVTCFALAVPRLARSAQATSRVDPTSVDLAQMTSALGSFKADIGRYPTNEEGIDALRVAPTDLLGVWRGPYLERPITPDAWGNSYVYKQSGSDNRDSCDIESYGADGKPGGVGSDADIVARCGH